MVAHPEVLYLARQLKALARASGFRLGELSERLGYHPNYLTRPLQGQIPLKVLHVFALLKELGTSAWVFFEGVYPLGGALTAALKRDLEEAEEVGLLPPSLLESGLVPRAGGKVAPAELTAEAARLLRDLLHRRGLKQNRVSVELGLGPMALGQALRGASSLTCQHLFGILRATRVSPERFFKELAGRPEGGPMAELEWALLLDALEHAFAPMLAAAAKRRQERES